MIEFKPRFFVLPVIAMTVLAMLQAPEDGGRSVQEQCGATVRIADPGIRASFTVAGAPPVASRERDLRRACE